MTMKTDMKYTLALTALTALALTSCTSTRVEMDDVQPGGVPIRVSVASDEPGTRSMLDNAAFQSQGNALQIWDAYYNDVQEPMAYLDGKYVVSDGKDNAVWPFRATTEVSSEQNHYYWTKTGVHRFYGVLVKDNSPLTSAPSSSALTPASLWSDGLGFGKVADEPYIYNIPERSMALDSPQFDFLYSNVVERDLDNGGGTAAVGLDFSHLFSAFAFTLTNDSPSPLTLTNVKLSIVTTASAQIDYTSAWSKDGNMTACPATRYSLGSVSSIQGIAEESASKTLPAGGTTPVKADIFNHAGDITSTTSDPGEFKLAWPQDLTGRTVEVEYSIAETVTHTYYEYVSNGRGGYDVENVTQNNGKGTYNRISSGQNTYYKYNKTHTGDYDVTFKSSYYGKYVVKSDSEKHDKNVKRAYPLGDKWEAGKRYLYNLVYSNNSIDLKVTVMQWNDGHGGSVDFN